MTIIFFNRDLGNAQFGLAWGQNNETPTIALNPGDTASFDLDVFHLIPEGANCRVFASRNGRHLFKQVVSKFKYKKGRGFGGTFSFYMRRQVPALAYDAG